MDMLILHRRGTDASPAEGTPWQKLGEAATPDGPVAINEYFLRHPGRVLGELRAVHGQYSAQDLTVRPSGYPLGNDLRRAIGDFAEAARNRGLTWQPRALAEPPAPVAPTPLSRAASSRLKEGSIVARPDGSFARAAGGLEEIFTPRPAKDAPELRQLLGLRDVLTEVMALEVFDPDTQTARKAPVFSTRVLAPRHRPLGADSAQDALALCLDERGCVDLEVIAGLLGVDAGTARAELGELVWDQPGTDRLVPRAEYLSGNVSTKLADAETAAADDARWGAHVEVLRAALPPDLGPAEIDARLGATWIDAADIARFGVEVLDAPTLRVEHVATAATDR
jgi:N12 class adenine-specific DNA methylase